MELSELQEETAQLHEDIYDEDEDASFQRSRMMGSIAVTETANDTSVFEDKLRVADEHGDDYEEDNVDGKRRQYAGRMLQAVVDYCIKHDIDLQRAAVEGMQDLRSQVHLVKQMDAGEHPTEQGPVDTDLDASEDRSFH